MSNTFEPKNDSEKEREQTSSQEESTLVDEDDVLSTFAFFDESQNLKKNAKNEKKGMRKGTKAIVASVGVLALLGGALAVLKLTEPEEQPAESSVVDDGEVVSLWSIESSAISNISVEKPDDDSFSVYRVMEEQESTNSMTGETSVVEVANYYLEGYDDLPMKTVDIRTLATRVASVSSVEVIQENTPQSDLAKYGLDDPIRVELTVDDSDPICFLVGDVTPVSSYSYLMIEGENTVYTVTSSTVSQYREDWMAYLSTSVTSEPADDDETILETILVERSDLDYNFYFEYDSFYVENSNGGSSAVHVMMEPLKCLLNAEKSSAVTHGIYGLTASRVEYPHPTEEQLIACGLTGEDSFVRVTTTTDAGDTIVFRLGNTYEVETEDENGETVTNTYYYGYLDTVNCIYGFSADDIAFDDLEPSDITSKIIVDTYVWDIGRLTYTAGDLVLDFEGIGTSSDDYVVTCNGEDVEAERFRLLYTYLLKTAAEDLVLEDVTLTGAPMASIKLERQDGARTTDVAFYEADGMKAYIVVDGEVRFKCRKAYVNTLISNLKIFHTEEEFTMTW